MPEPLLFICGSPGFFWMSWIWMMFFVLLECKGFRKNGQELSAIESESLRLCVKSIAAKSRCGFSRKGAKPQRL